MGEVAGVALAGGESARMGRDKAAAPVGGKPMGEWVAEALRSVFDRTAAVGRKDSLAGLPAIPDAPGGGRGPLRGVVTALRLFACPVVAVAVDQPLVRPETLRRLAAAASDAGTAVCVDVKPQVTCAAYSPECLPEAERILAEGGSLQNLLRVIPWRRLEKETWSRWGEDGRSWFSMDDEEAIITAENRFRLDLRRRPEPL